MTKTLTHIIDGKRAWTKEGLEELDWAVHLPHAKIALISQALVDCGLKGDRPPYSLLPVFFYLPPHLFIRITRKGEVIIGKYDPDAVAEDDEMEENILEWVKDPTTLFESIRDTWDKVSATHK